jgi:hypothetical protein
MALKYARKTPQVQQVFCDTLKPLVVIILVSLSKKDAVKLANKNAGAIRDLILWAEQQGALEDLHDLLLTSFSLSPVLTSSCSDQLKQTIV